MKHLGLDCADCGSPYGNTTSGDGKRVLCDECKAEEREAP